MSKTPSVVVRNTYDTLCLSTVTLDDSVHSLSDFKRLLSKQFRGSPPVDRQVIICGGRVLSNADSDANDLRALFDGSIVYLSVLGGLSYATQIGMAKPNTDADDSQIQIPNEQMATPQTESGKSLQSDTSAESSSADSVTPKALISSQIPIATVMSSDSGDDSAIRSALTPKIDASGDVMKDSTAEMAAAHFDAYQQYFTNYLNYRDKYLQLCAQHSAQLLMPFHPALSGGSAQPCQWPALVRPPTTASSGMRLQQQANGRLLFLTPLPMSADMQATANASVNATQEPSAVPRPQRGAEEAAVAGVNGGGGAAAPAQAQVAAAEPRGVFAEAAAVEAAAARRRPRGFMNLFYYAGWLFGLLQFAIVIRLSIFIYIFGQNLTPNQYYALIGFCLVYYVVKIRLLKALYNATFGQPMAARPAVEGAAVNAQQPAAADAAAANAPPNPASQPPTRQMELDEFGNEVVTVRMLAAHQLIHRFFIGLVCSFYPQWHYSFWYPAPAQHTEVQPGVVDPNLDAVVH